MNEEIRSPEFERAVADAVATTAGKVIALETVIHALLGTLGKSLPPLLPVLQQNLFALADIRERDLDEEQRQAFRSTIVGMDRAVEALK